MRCLYCDRRIEKMSLRSAFLEEDLLCAECRNGLRPRKKTIVFPQFKVDTYFEYDSLFKSLLLQYKECKDEALKKVFLYELKDKLNIRYYGYKMILIPSSKTKLEERGFNHLEGIFGELRLETVKGLRMKEELCQEGKNASERAKMAENYVYEGEKLKKVLIVDDVVTTGSSLLGAWRCISLCAEKVKVLSLAYKNNTLHY